MRSSRAKLVLPLIALVAACSDDPMRPGIEQIEITPSSLLLGEQRQDSVRLRNLASAPIGPIDIKAGAVLDAHGGDEPAISLAVDPARIESLAAGGTARVRVSIVLSSQPPTGDYTTELILRVADGEPRTISISFSIAPVGVGFELVGHAEVTDRFTSDLWVHSWPQGDFAYTGTWGCRPACGDRAYIWDVTDPSAPALTDSVELDATTVNDVKIRSDGALAVVTHEGSPPNGITLLDLSNPAHPTVITRFTERLDGGVHNVWIEGDYVYAVSDGTLGLEVIDISTPSAPQHVASFYAGSSFLHDVYVRDGLAFLSHWDEGLVILDVGNGMEGGTPEAPVEVSRVPVGGNTHNAWYWPAGGYVFVGEENFGVPPGEMHVVDVSDLRNPVEVATFSVPGDTPHNFWLDEQNAILYAAWYSQGVRAIDVSGELQGALGGQGREIGSSRYNGSGQCFSGTATCTWAPQLHDGLIFLSDPNTGLWVLRPRF